LDIKSILEEDSSLGGMILVAVVMASIFGFSYLLAWYLNKVHTKFLMFEGFCFDVTFFDLESNSFIVVIISQMAIAERGPMARECMI